MSCIFCKIAAGEIPAKEVYRDERAVAFHDLHPQAPTHVLIIPKKHVVSIADLGEDVALAGHLVGVARTVAQTLGLGGGYRVVTNVGSDGGQSVFHLHFHVLGGRPLGWPPG